MKHNSSQDLVWLTAMSGFVLCTIFSYFRLACAGISILVFRGIVLLYVKKGIMVLVTAHLRDHAKKYHVSDRLRESAMK